MSGIQLHPKLGVNPRILLCPRCGEGSTIVLLGIRNRIDTCDICKKNWIGGMRECTCGNTYKTSRELRDSERDIPGDILCTKCEEEVKQFKQIVREGGLHFKCAECKQIGVIRKNNFTMHVRKQHAADSKDDGFLEPHFKELGFEFSSCSQHATTAGDE